ncbi:MAG: glycoside hydrolase family 52 protein [Clostridia bacterium]|nr:glycoside hydrolase family 52 protein [Clostridia bacterium]
MACPLFNTHHAPVGAWASLTFGVPGVACSVDLQEPNVKKTGALFIGSANKNGVRSIGFADEPIETGINVNAEGDKEKAPQKRTSKYAAYGMAKENEINRVLTPSKDTYSVDNISFTVYTPYAALPDPNISTINPIDCIPAVLIDITVDNSDSDLESVAFLGFIHTEAKRLYAQQYGNVYSLQYRNEWAFSAKGDNVYVVRGLDAIDHLKNGTQMIQQNGPEFLCTKVAPHTKKTLTVVWSVYAIDGSNGEIPTTYYYTKFFNSLLDVTNSAFEMADVIRERSNNVDNELIKNQDKKRMEVVSQSIRGYYASSQLLVSNDGRIHWNVGEGAYVWRNTIDLCVDHLAWELRRNPWIVRSLMEDFIDYYRYYDDVTFEGKDGTFPGGISFTHDMGCYFSYSKKGYSAYERENDTVNGFYFYMTTEELLNGIYCIAAYVLKTGDKKWLMSHADIISDLMTSLENRDAPTVVERNGILKAASTRGGNCHLESTTYDALDHSLLEASGNLYVFIKTWCSLILLEKCATLIENKDVSCRANAMLNKCRRSIDLFKTSDNHLKSNAYRKHDGKIAAAVEPLAIPYVLGVLNANDEPLLFEILKTHINECLKPGICLDALSGGLRLSSTSRNTWVSKTILTAYVIETVLNIKLPETVIPEIVGWTQNSAKIATVADQILCDTRQMVGGPYYPRIVTSALWL